MADLSLAMPLPEDVDGAEALDLPGVVCGPLPAGKAWKRRTQLLCETCPKADETHRSWANHGPMLVDQPTITGEVVADAVVAGGSLADTNYGGGNELEICGSAVSDNKRKSWLRFEFTIPEGATIVGARLTLRVVTGQTDTIMLSALNDDETNDWLENEITWTNAPGNDTASATGLIGAETVELGSKEFASAPALGASVEWSTVDYPLLLAALRADTDGKLTLILHAAGASTLGTQFASKDYTPSGGDAGDWAPSLAIDYQEGESTGLRAVDEHVIERWNRQIEFLMQAQYLNLLLHRIKWGLHHNNQASFEMTRLFQFGFVSASGSTIIAQRLENNSDPGAIEWNRLVYNPATNTSEVVDFSGRLIPCGVVGVQGSILEHSQWIVRNIPIAGTGHVAVGGTFAIHVLGDVGTLATPFPAGAEMTVALTVIGDEPEGWILPRRVFPLFTERRVWTVLAASFPEGGVFPLRTPGGLDVRVKSPSSPQWFNVLKYTAAGGVEDITAAASLGVQVTHLDVSTVDLSGLIDDAASVVITYHFESDNESARWSGQRMCRWAVEDPTGSHGVAGGWSGRENGEGSKFYCGLAGASGRGNFDAGCYQVGVCDGFTEDRPTSPYDRALLRQIIVGDEGGPWQEWSQAGNPEPYVYRSGPPCLTSNAGLDMSVPDGYHLNVGWPNNGGWEKWESNAAGSLSRIKGFWWWDSIVDVDPVMGTPATYPDHGPAGGNWATRRLEIGDGNHDATSDPLEVSRALLTSAGLAISPYIGTVINGLGYFTRCGARLYTWVLQRLGISDDPQIRTDGTFTRAYFDEDFNLQATLNEGGVTTFYGAKFTLAARGAAVDRAQTNAAVRGAMRIATVHKASIVAGQLVLELINGEEWAGTLVTVGEAYETNWAQGGLNVECPDHMKNRNYLSGFNHGHDETKIKAGMVATLPAALFGEASHTPRAYAVMSAEPFAGEAQSWAPGGGSLSAAVRRRRNLPGTHFIPFNNQDGTETIYQVDGATTQITVQRNGGADQLSLIRSTHPRPYLAGGLALDQYFVMEGFNELTAEYGVWFWFSQRNAQAATAIHSLWIMLQTYHATTGAGLVNYGILYHDVHPLATSWSVTGTHPVASIDAVKIRTKRLDEDGQRVIVTLAPMASLPATGNDWPGTDYYFVTPGATIGDYVFWTHMQYGADEAIVAYTPSEVLGSEEAFYAARVAIHGERSSGTLPAGHATVANKGDLVRLADENGICAAILAADEHALDGLQVTFSHGLIAHPVDATHEPIVTRAGFGDAVTEGDVALDRGTDYEWFGAAGVGFLRITEAGEVPAGDCLVVQAHGADRTSIMRAAEHAALRRTNERLLEQGLAAGISGIVDEFYSPTQVFLDAGYWQRANAGYGDDAFNEEIPPGFVGTGVTNPTIGALGLHNDDLAAGGTYPYYEIGSWFQLAGGMMRIPELDRCPWTAADVVSAKGAAFGGFTTRIDRVHFSWEATNVTGNGIWHPGREQWFCTTIDAPEFDDEMAGSVVLAKVYDAGADTLRPIPVLTSGVGGNLSATPAEVDLVDFVKAYLGQKNNGARGFFAYPTFGDGSPLVPGEEATLASLRRIRDACVTWGLTYDEDPADVEVPGYGSMHVDRWGAGTVEFKRVDFSISVVPIVVEFAGGFTLHANARVAYEVPPAAD